MSVGDLGRVLGVRRYEVVSEKEVARVLDSVVRRIGRSWQYLKAVGLVRGTRRIVFLVRSERRKGKSEGKRGMCGMR
jgi:hypothetical protein